MKRSLWAFMRASTPESTSAGTMHRSRIPSRWTLRPTGKLTTRWPSATITMLASESNGTNSSRMQGTAKQGAAPRRCRPPSSAPAARGRRSPACGFSARREAPAAARLRERRSSSTASKPGRAQPVVAGVRLLAQAVLRIVKGFVALRDVVFPAQRNRAISPGTFSNS